MSLQCSVGECESPVTARGWCRKHYLRWYKHGDPLADRTWWIHGQHDTPLYHCWEAMKRRAGNRDGHHPTYADVRCDPRWSSFTGFLANQPPGRKYEPGLCLSRHGDAGDYTPENTAWLERAENSRQQASYRRSAS